MDVARPIKSVIPTLDAPVLEVLAGTNAPLTGREIHRIARTGSNSGINRTLGRLVAHGLVNAESRASATFYIANREHLAWPAIEALTRIRQTLLENMRNELRSWDPAPVHASLFGSVARREGDIESDIDILLIRPDGVEQFESPWEEQKFLLSDHVGNWTGNHCHVFQIDLSRLKEYIAIDDPLVHNWLRDSINLAGSELSVVIGRLNRGGT